MMTKRCRSNPVMTCIYGPCYFGGPCHLRDEARREAISAGEVEYASWLPVGAATLKADDCVRCGKDICNEHGWCNDYLSVRENARRNAGVEASDSEVARTSPDGTRGVKDE